MRSILTLGLLLTLFATAPLAHAEVQLFDFDGQALVPDTVGDTLEMFSIVVNGAQIAAPLPLDFDQYEYTIVVTGLTLDLIGVTDLYSGGTVILYEDSATPANYADPATFQDGTAILVGTLTALDHTMFVPTLGVATGTVDWTGGTRAGEFDPADLDNWSLLVNVSRSSTQVEAGYDERWDGKLEPKEGVVAATPASWGSLKANW